MEEIKKSQEQIKELKKELTGLKCSVEHTMQISMTLAIVLTRSMTAGGC